MVILNRKGLILGHTVVEKKELQTALQKNQDCLRLQDGEREVEYWLGIDSIKDIGAARLIFFVFNLDNP